MSQRRDIIVAERVQQMKDVVIKAPRITTQGDTINYRVSAFQQQNDLSIGQVLKRLPGITVSDIGQSLYVKGKENGHVQAYAPSGAMGLK